MPQQLPLIPTTPNYRVGTTLNGTNVVLDIRWNARDGAWYMDILTEDEVAIAYGVKIVLGTLLGGRVVSALFPRGYMMASDLTGAGSDAGLDELGERIQVLFFEPDEVA